MSKRLIKRALIACLSLAAFTTVALAALWRCCDAAIWPQVHLFGGPNTCSTINSPANNQPQNHQPGHELGWDTKMLPLESKSQIASMVRTGFFSRDRLLEIFTEEMYAPGELAPQAVAAELARQFAQYEKEKQSYPSTTDCDRLDAAFQMMNKQGIIAIQNAGYTQSDGYEDIGDHYNQLPNKDSVLGYCFYHGQDLEDAVRGKGLYLAFGPMNPAQEQTVGIDVGNIVRDSLEANGLTVEWDGTFKNRIKVPNLLWQKR